MLHSTFITAQVHDAFVLDAGAIYKKCDRLPLVIVYMWAEHPAGRKPKSKSEFRPLASRGSP